MKQTEENLLALLRPEVQAMNAYRVPESLGLIKLDAMENPYAWPDKMKQEWLQLMSEAEPNRYPDPAAKQLVSQLRTSFGVDSALGLVLGNGSDELIQLVLMALCEGSVVMAPTPTFVMYQHVAHSLGLVFTGVPLQNDFSLDVTSMLKVIERDRPAVIFLAYPNNPTANLFSEQDVVQIIEAAPGLVIVDEAYQPFAKKSFLEAVIKYPQLLVMRTVSKLGLAGLRLGYLVGTKSMTDQLEKIRLPYNINIFTQLTARFAFDHSEVLQQQAEQLCEQREQMLKRLADLKGLSVFPSDANFILFSLVSAKAAQIFAALKEAGVLVKNMTGVEGLPAQCLRVTVGTESQNKLFMDALENILKS
ncbi:MAG: histidinol-phosphate aminotransferase [Cycloclasticus sp. symbiont of Poecilosclerida sp. M]|nr:MAG: histidinol-phosphate aminotransferase [Cycloclasticus sp. symbiont of Poecilosclerida sp. M]